MESKMAVTQKNWNARRYVKDGIERYCAPACGYDCKAEMHDNAMARAWAAKAAMKNSQQWEIHVWENLGWHASITNGYIKLYCEPDGTFRTLMSFDKDSGGGDPRITPHISFKDAREAVEHQVMLADDLFKQATLAMTACLQAVRGA
jgi:hypothetical protein